MARDRKRAKQRQRQQRKAAQSSRTRAPLAVETRPTTDPPEAIDEASGDAEQAKVVAAAGQPEPEPEDRAEPVNEPDSETRVDETDSQGRVDEPDNDEPADEPDNGGGAGSTGGGSGSSPPGEEPAAPESGAPAGGETTRGGGNRLLNFLRACWAELQRVRWPDRRQVGQATGVVLGFVVIAGGYLGLMDAIFSRVVDAIL